MKHILIIFLLTISLPVMAFSQSEYTIPRKHRVIQEKTRKTQNVPIGTRFSDLDFKSLQEQTYTISTLSQHGPVIFVFLSAECPVAQRYAMRLKRMYNEFNKRNVTLVGVYSNENDSVGDVQDYLKKAEFPFPIVKDTDGSLARHIGATMTPQAHLIDNTGVLRYRGPIDDNRYETRVKHNYLMDALVAVINGTEIQVKEAPSFGCTIHLPDQPIEKRVIFNEHFLQIVENMNTIMNFLLNAIK